MNTSETTKRNWRFQDIAGKKFGRLTAVSVAKTVNGKAYWNCVCDCGHQPVVSGGHLRGGRIRSCGCLKSEVTAARLTTHGGSKTTLYCVWRGMVERCENPNHIDYARYGGRGIRLCDRWRKSFTEFASDMGERPSPRHQIDRIDNNRGYEPGNCRWATSRQQTRNTRRNRIVTHDGKSLCVAEWSELVGIAPSIISERLRSGWTAKDALTRPVKATF